MEKNSGVVASQISKQIVDEFKKRWDTSHDIPTRVAPTLYQRILDRRNKPTSFRSIAPNHLAQCVYMANHIYADNGKKETFETFLKGKMKAA